MQETPTEEGPARAPDAAVAKPKLSERLKALMAEYGPVAVVLYFVIFFLVLAGFAIAIRAGFDVEGAGQTTGLLAGAWVATKLTQPIRILATLALTPLVAKGWERLRGRKR